MIIEINKDYIIKPTDKHNMTVVKNIIPEKGKPYYKNIGYYGSLSGALRGCLNNPAIIIGIKDRKEFEKLLERIENVSKSLK